MNYLPNKNATNKRKSGTESEVRRPGLDTLLRIPWLRNALRKVEVRSPKASDQVRMKLLIQHICIGPKNRK